MNVLQAEIFSHNRRSAGVLLKAGFRYIKDVPNAYNKRGTVIDAIVYRRPLVLAPTVIILKSLREGMHVSDALCTNWRLHGLKVAHFSLQQFKRGVFGESITPGEVLPVLLAAVQGALSIQCGVVVDWSEESGSNAQSLVEALGKSANVLVYTILDHGSLDQQIRVSREVTVAGGEEQRREPPVFEGTVHDIVNDVLQDVY